MNGQALARSVAIVVCVVFGLVACGSTPPAAKAAAGAAGGLQGSSWRLVQIDLGNGAIRAAIDRSRYTLGFGANRVLNVRFDCNRGSGKWHSPDGVDLEFGPLALTRAFCGVQSLDDELVRQWPKVRSYSVKDGRLYLSLAEDGGTIEFEPAP